MKSVWKNQNNAKILYYDKNSGKKQPKLIIKSQNKTFVEKGQKCKQQKN